MFKWNIKMERIVYFANRGRFTNNLFQYFAAEIIKKIFNYDKVLLNNNQETRLNCIVFYDWCYVDIITKYINNQPIPELNKHIYLDGFFQRTEIFKHLKDFIYSLFTIENKNYFNSEYRICDIVPDDTSSINNEDLTLHIRLDDFVSDIQIFKPEEVKEKISYIMNKHNLKQLYIVCDVLKQKWEFEYMANFLNLDPIFVNGNIIEDFHYMMKSSYLFTSASTLSWMSGFLGNKYNSNKIYIPYNKIFREQKYNQYLVDFDENCEVFYDLNYIDKP